MSECTCYWTDQQEPVRMLNPECPSHGAVSPPPKPPKVIWPDSPRNRDEG